MPGVEFMCIRSCVIAIVLSGLVPAHHCSSKPRSHYANMGTSDQAVLKFTINLTSDCDPDDEVAVSAFYRFGLSLEAAVGFTNSSALITLVLQTFSNR